MQGTDKRTEWHSESDIVGLCKAVTGRSYTVIECKALTGRSDTVRLYKAVTEERREWHSEQLHTSHWVDLLYRNRTSVRWSIKVPPFMRPGNSRQTSLRPTTVPPLGQLNSVHTIQNNLFKIILPSTPRSQTCVSFMFSTKLLNIFLSRP